jgi:hypothetical protein
MLTAHDVLAQNNFGDTRTGGLAGPLGLLLVVLLGIATFLLIRNMNARLRRLPAEFPDQNGETGAETGSDTGRKKGVQKGVQKSVQEGVQPNVEADRAGEPTSPDKAP